MRHAVFLKPWIVILALHGALAGFVTLRGYPITQDGPAHAYGAHIIHSLAYDPGSPFRGYFQSNLHPIGNSLFFYVADWGESVASPERITGLALLIALLGLPLSAFALAAALRGQAPEPAATGIDPSAAAVVACPLAYNYFLYRGFFNFCWSVPLAIGCLAAIVATGRSAGGVRLAALALAAVLLAALAALAHPAALVFLLCAIPAACLVGSHTRRAVGAGVMGVLLALAWTSRVSSGGSSPTVFCTPWSSVIRAVRVLGVTHGWPEVLVALALLALFVEAGVRALTPRGTLRARWSTAWPAACAVVMMVAFFFVPFEYGGAAGHNERIPLIAAMLLAPFVAMPGRRAGWFLVAFAVFGIYTGAQSVRFERLAARVRNAGAVEAIPRGSIAYPVVLQLRLGSLAADLGRHILADIARRRDLVMPDVFCGHPAHPLRCTSRVPVRVGEDEVERFDPASQLDPGAALSDRDLRGMFDRMRREAARAQYLVVLSSPALFPVFQSEVATPLGAEPIGPIDSLLVVYRVGVKTNVGLDGRTSSREGSVSRGAIVPTSTAAPRVTSARANTAFEAKRRPRRRTVPDEGTAPAAGVRHALSGTDPARCEPGWVVHAGAPGGLPQRN